MLWEGSLMLLRDHLLMSYKGAPSWPPDWFWRDDRKIAHEVSTLKQVIPYPVYSLAPKNS